MSQEKVLSLKEEFEQYAKYISLHERCEKIFADTDMEDKVDEIVELLLNKASPKTLYLNSLKQFGRKSGTETYRELKKMLA